MAMSQERKGTIAVSLTNFLDSGCIVASSVALTAWAAAFGFGSMWTSILGAIGANAFGAAIGALIGGFLTDKYGRTIIYRYNLLVYAIGVAIAMCAMNLPMVVVGVVLSGLSVGAGVPASWSYISETSTSTKRAANIGISQFAWSCGPAIIFLLSLALSFALPWFRSRRQDVAARRNLRSLRRPAVHAHPVPGAARGGPCRMESAAPAAGVQGLVGEAGRSRLSTSRSAA